ncbi:preprotein translocase subunit SecY [Candidatus Woesearchaeota archaeon]|nr:preprotein translocase subunit SecY [Candidatus Woesearchaeota archaeon]
MSWWKVIIANLPEVAGPTQKRLSFKEKLKWTGITLIIFFVLSLIPLFGLGQNALEQFEYLSIILGAKFGSIMSLGIGPIVTASIVLQLLNGSGIIKFDLTSEEGKKNFQGIQKLLAIFFIIFEAAIYVFMGGLAPASELAGMPVYFQLQMLLVFQLFLGGMLILFMDEIISKWGFGSGISLFIAAGVSEQIFIRALNPLSSPTNPDIAIGAIPALFQSLAAGDPITALLMAATVIATIIVFVLAVYAQAMKIEIPLSFGRVRGYGMRWPLHFIYTSNIPVILVAALMANLQLWARLLQRATEGCRQAIQTGGVCSTGQSMLTSISNFFGTFQGNSPESGLVVWLQSPNIVNKVITGTFQPIDMAHASVYALFMIGGAVLFSVFWVQTAGMDAKSQAKQILSSGLQIPGFRKDQRILEHLLNRYIWPLTVMGAITVGALAALADLGGALSRGTGILLTVMIIYRLYEEIAKQHMMDMHPMMRKFME